MKVVLAGGSGFLGRALSRALVQRAHTVVILSRHAGASSPGVRFASWQPESANARPEEPSPTPPLSSSDWRQEIDGADAVVNLAGAGIADVRWTPSRKQLLRESRLTSTRQLVDAVRT